MFTRESHELMICKRNGF